MPIFTAQDAQVAMNFAINQVSRIHPRVYEIKYPEIRYRGLLPVDTTGPEWVKSITYFSMDQVGQAEWFNAGSDDIPHADVLQDKAETTVSMAAIGYGYNIEELAQAQMLGIDLNPRKARAARRASELMIDQIALFGDVSKGFYGITNNPNVSYGNAPATGTASSTAWADKTADNVLADINALLTGVWTSSNTVEMADTLLLPSTQMHALGSRRLSSDSEVTLLEWILRTNTYTLETGNRLTIRSLRGLETAGAGNSTRMVAYRNDEEVLRLNMPMPFRFFPVWQVGPMRWEIPGAMRVGGVDISLPKAVRYMDAI